MAGDDVVVGEVASYLRIEEREFELAGVDGTCGRDSVRCTTFLGEGDRSAAASQVALPASAPEEALASDARPEPGVYCVLHFPDSIDRRWFEKPPIPGTRLHSHRPHYYDGRWYSGRTWVVDEVVLSGDTFTVSCVGRSEYLDKRRRSSDGEKEEVGELRKWGRSCLYGCGSPSASAFLRYLVGLRGRRSSFCVTYLRASRVRWCVISTRAVGSRVLTGACSSCSGSAWSSGSS